mmetsp:Transcript_26366/g.26613  ORF Transcript_26366/g.26613 Transcript_26366/m.26613 type:complete len:214 (-) Transcript_26366:133-774(-)
MDDTMMDPSLTDGFHVIYDREVPMEIRNHIQGETEIRPGSLEAIKVKILVLGPDDSPTSIRLEFTSEADLFFSYMHRIDRTGYRIVQEQQKLMIDFPEYSNVLIRMLNLCIREPQTHLAVFMMYGETEARLDFIQNMDYKFVELMSCNCDRTPEEVTQQQITFRYNALKQKLSLTQSKLQDMQNAVKLKNPSLLLQLQQKSSGNNISTVSIRR